MGVSGSRSVLEKVVQKWANSTFHTTAMIFLHQLVKLANSIFVVEWLKSNDSTEAKLRVGDGVTKSHLWLWPWWELSFSSMGRMI